MSTDDRDPTTTAGATLLVRGGTVFDGTGAEGRRSDVLVRDGRVTRVGRDLPAEGVDEVVEADGCWVLPGFVDLHTHYDAELEMAPGLVESLRHGVTSVLVGSCGLSFAVGGPEDLADMFCRVEGVPRAQVLPLLRRVQDWDAPKTYLEHLDRLPLGPNVTSFLGHSALRAHVLGLERALDESVEATPDELGRMATMLEEALDAGYLGLSVNTLPWDKMDGDRFRSRPTPSVFSTWGEYRHLGRVLRRRGAIFQGVPDVSGRWNLALFIGMASGIGRRPLKTTVISMMDIRAARGAHRVLGAVTSATRRVLRADVRFQSLPQPFELYTDGLENPVLEEIGAGTEALHLEPSARAQLLREPGYRKRFRAQWTNRWKGRAYHRDLGEARIVSAPEEGLAGRTFAEVARQRGQDPVECFLDLQATHGNDLRWRSVVANDRPDELAWIVEHPQAIIGFSDAGAHLRNMAFYNFPLHLLRLVRDRQAAGLPTMTLGRAVHRVTGEIADYLGVEAGHLRPGDRADLVVVDPAGLDDRLDDLHEEPVPGLDGLRRLVRRNDDAVRAVYVNGRLAWDGRSPVPGLGRERGFGRVLRGALR
jgi:N-acyl-D-aspartate/D-glutamate deacylase